MKKLLINLLSEQMLPNLIAILEEKPDEVTALTTPDYAEQVERFEKFSGTPHRRRDFKPYDLAGNIRAVTQMLTPLSESTHVSINFTCGTKIMSLAAVLPALGGRGPNIEIIYIDTHDDCIHRISRASSGKLLFHPPEKLTIPIPFQAYVALKGETLVSQADVETPEQWDRRELARCLAEQDEVRPIFRKQKNMFESSGGTLRPRLSYETTFAFKGRGGRFGWHPGELFLNTPSGGRFNFFHPDGGEFFSGKWLEEYVAAKLRDAGAFDQVLTQVVLSLRPETIAKFREDRRQSPFTDKNELDVVVTRGRKAAIIECKAGKVTQDHVYKLATLKDYLLGPFGKAFLVCRFQPDNPGIMEKCRDVGIILVAEKDIREIANIVLAALC